MKVIILAAGSGTRLGPKNIPKPLTPLITGQSILARQIEQLEKFVSLDDILLVVGYQKELIMEAFPNLLYVYNPDYAKENTAGSLLRGLRKIEDDLLWLNGDVVFHPEALHALLADDTSKASKQSNNQAKMLVNKGETNDEAMKYRTDSSARILEISKQVTQSEGEALGINYFPKQDLPLFRQCLAKCNTKDYFEQGISYVIQQNLPIIAVPIECDFCVEVDFPEDLEKANQLLTKWN